MISMPAIMKQQIICALGCTEPSAIALAVAVAKEALGEQPESVKLFVSGNILKNAMSVGIPGTELKGIEIVAALGSVAGKSAYLLEVLKDVTADDVVAAKKMIADGGVKIALKKECQDRLYIEAQCIRGSLSATAVINGSHTNVSRICRNGEVNYQKQTNVSKEYGTEESYHLNLSMIWEYINQVDTSELAFLSEIIEVNSSIAEEGLKKVYGMGVGKHLYDRTMKTGQMDFQTYVVSYTAAAADARMAGCFMPVMAITGSGNQGLTASLPVVAAARWLKCSDEKLYRALALSELVTIHVKEHIGKLSALCGCAIAASIGSACGLVYLQGGSYVQIEYAVKNMVADVSGLVCDGAKAGCALKIATSVAGAVQCAALALEGIQVPDHDGIVWTDVEKTIRNLGELGNRGMRVTDEVILDMMLDGQNE